MIITQIIRSLLMFSLVCSASLFQPRAADAGLFVSLAQGQLNIWTVFAGGALGAATGTAVGGMLSASDLSWYYDTVATGALAGAGIGILLDIDGSLPKDALYQKFKQDFPFIDNSEALSRLTEATRFKFNQMTKENGDSAEFMIRFSLSEIEENLQDADLNQTQIEMVAQQLK